MLNAKDLIAQRGLKTAPDLTAAQLKEVKQVIEHNDTMTSPQRRVGASSVLQLLHDLGWLGRTRRALDEVCRRQFKRTSFARP